MEQDFPGKATHCKLFSFFSVTAGFATCRVRYVRVRHMFATDLHAEFAAYFILPFYLLPRSFRTNILF